MRLARSKCIQERNRGIGDTAHRQAMEATVFRDQIVNFLEAAVVFLLVTNALSIAATTWAIQLLNGVAAAGREPGFIERKVNALLSRTS